MIMFIGGVVARTSHILPTDGRNCGSTPLAELSKLRHPTQFEGRNHLTSKYISVSSVLLEAKSRIIEHALRTSLLRVRPDFVRENCFTDASRTAQSSGILYRFYICLTKTALTLTCHTTPRQPRPGAPRRAPPRPGAPRPAAPRPAPPRGAPHPSPQTLPSPSRPAMLCHALLYPAITCTKLSDSS